MDPPNVAELLLRMYRAARELSSEEFEVRTLNWLHGLIQENANATDPARLTRTATRSARIVAGSVDAHRLRESAPCRRMRLPDLADVSLTQPGASSAHWAPPRWISLIHADDAGPASQSVRLAHELLPHFSQAYRINRLVTQPRERPSEDPDSHVALGLADTHRILRYAEPRFRAFIALEFGPESEFASGLLPEPILRAVAGRHGGAFVGSRIRCDARERAGLLLLEAGAKSALDDLPPKRRQIARLFAAGHSAQDISLRLNVSPSTVRNQLTAAYRELNVTRKSQLRELAYPTFDRPTATPSNETESSRSGSERK